MIKRKPMENERRRKKLRKETHEQLWEKENMINLGVRHSESKILPTWIGPSRLDVALAIAQGLCASRAQHGMGIIAQSAPEICATSFLLADEMFKIANYDTKQLTQYMALNAKKAK